MKEFKLYLSIMVVSLFLVVQNISAYSRDEVYAQNISEISVPIKIYNDLILIEGSIDGTKGYFVWDNGFSFSAINKKLDIEKESIRDTSIVAADPLANNVSLDLYRIKSLSMGDLILDNPEVIEVDTDLLFPCGEHNILGFIGSNVINIFSWSFDFDNNTVKISDSDFEVQDTNALYIDYMIDSPSNLHYMPISINDIDGFTLVDWGLNSVSLNILESFKSLFQESQQKYTVEGNSITTISGTSKINRQYVLNNQYKLKMGSVEIGDKYRPTVNLISEGVSDVVLGNYFFRANYNVIVNSTQSQYVLLQRWEPKDVKDISETINYGVTLSKLENGSIDIDGIIKEHPDVVSSAIQPSMIVESINGKKSDKFANQCELDNYVKSLKGDNKNIVLKLQNGKTATLHLVNIWSAL